MPPAVGTMFPAAPTLVSAAVPSLRCQPLTVSKSSQGALREEWWEVWLAHFTVQWHQATQTGHLVLSSVVPVTFSVCGYHKGRRGRCLAFGVCNEYL